MRKSRFTEAQIIGMIKEQEAGLPTSEFCRKHGLSPATLYRLKAKYGGMDLSDAKRLKQLEDENAKLKRLDFLSDTFGACRRFGILAVNDDCCRENLALIADRILRN